MWKKLRAIPKKTLYFRIYKTLYLKFQYVLLQKQNFKFNFKVICILHYNPYICHN